MQAFDIEQLIGQRQPSDAPYLEFLRVPALSAGLYTLPAGGVDRQQPHTEDEIYYIVRGRALIRVADEDREVQPGSLVFVAAGVEHRFHSIAEELTTLVLFAPAEYSLASRNPAQ